MFGKWFKKVIIFCLAIVILIPTILCIILFGKLNKLEKQMQKLETRLLVEAYDSKESIGAVASQQDEMEQNEVEDYTNSLSGNSASGNTVSENKIHVYLTFDDGPSDNTDQILDILKEYNVKATFFVVGKSEKYTPLYRRIVEEGHSIGMHSYSHRYSEIYQDVESFGQDMKRLQQLIYDKTGVISNIYRFPGGSSNTVSKVDMGELIAYLGGQGITYYDWNVSSHDADNNNGELTVDDIVESVTGNIQTRDNSIVLMHDANDKRLTVEALPIIIEKLQAMDHVEILPISEDTVKIQHTTLEEN